MRTQIGACVLALVVLSTSPLEAQSAPVIGGGGASAMATGGGEGSCQVCYDYPGGSGGLTGPNGGGHGFDGWNCSSPGPVDGNSYCMDCEAFKDCHPNTQYQEGGCRQWHWYCGLNHAMVDAVEEAARTGTAEVLLVWAREAPESFRVSADGEYMMIRNCTNQVVGAIKLEPTLS